MLSVSLGQDFSRKTEIIRTIPIITFNLFRQQSEINVF